MLKLSSWIYVAYGLLAEILLLWALRREVRSVAGRPTSYTEPTNEMLGALAALPYKQRAAVTLRYWADWTDEQIAGALGCAPASVRVLLHRGLTALKKEIEG